MAAKPCRNCGSMNHGVCVNPTAPEATHRPCKADLYGEDFSVLPTCQCGWEGPSVPTYDEAADAYALHRLAGQMKYDREVLVWVLVYHQPTNTSGCICGWGVLGASHPEHVADVYEMILGRDFTPGQATEVEWADLRHPPGLFREGNG